MEPFEEAAKAIKNSNNTVARTGAGISVESGIPDFRSPGGLWSKYDPMEFGHIRSFQSHPGKVWQMLLEIDTLLERATPNRAHLSLAKLEEMGMLHAIITQNIDSLHQKAGSNKVIEYHGHGRSLRCDACGKTYPRSVVDQENLPPLCTCGDPLRPEVVFFGEPIPVRARQEADTAAAGCRVMLIIGTSASVAPANYLPIIAKNHGAKIIEVNPMPTDLSEHLKDISIREKASKVLETILKLVTIETKTKI